MGSSRTSVAMRWWRACAAAAVVLCAAVTADTESFMEVGDADAAAGQWKLSLMADKDLVQSASTLLCEAWKGKGFCETKPFVKSRCTQCANSGQLGEGLDVASSSASQAGGSCADHRAMSVPYTKKTYGYKRKKYGSRCAYYMAKGRCKSRWISRNCQRTCLKKGKDKSRYTRPFV